MLPPTAAEVAADAIATHTATNSTELIQLLKAIYGDAYLAGTHAAAEAAGAAVISEFGSLDGSIDWDAWAPGYGEAANVVADGGLQTLLDGAGVTVKDMTGTALDMLGNVLADGLAAGDNLDTISASLDGRLANPDRADMIAHTETARAMTSAATATYKQNGIAQVTWLAEGDADDECADYDGQTYDLADVPAEPPVHPWCRCALAPVVHTTPDDSE